jgi:mono/diheme cytochrome c family protein
MPTSRFSPTAALCMLLLATACSHGGGDHSSVRATPTLPSASRGAALFSANCAVCHGNRGTGGRIGPSLRDERKHRSAGAVRAIIADPEPPMPKLYPARLSTQDVDDLTAYVETL